jgi:DNA-binding MarR family transcriptional regulator
MSSARIDRYVDVVRGFSARVVLFHGAVADRVGLNATDLKVLRLLGEDAMTASQLAQRVGLTGAAVTALVDRLELAGYVTRERDTEDRRRVTLRAVPAMVKKIDRVYDSQNAAMERLLAGYSASQFDLLIDYLQRATAVLEEQTTKLRAEH